MKSADDKLARHTEAAHHPWIILGIDPGKTSGWAIYDATRNLAVSSGEFTGDALPSEAVPITVSVCVVEVPVGQGPTYPDVVRAGVVAGQLHERLRSVMETHFLERLAIRQRLTTAVHGIFRVTNDPTAWRAVKLILCGREDCDLRGSKKLGREPGPLAHVKGKDARAALAAAVAWTLPAHIPTQAP